MKRAARVHARGPALSPVGFVSGELRQGPAAALPQPGRELEAYIHGWIEDPTGVERASEVTVEQFTDGTFATPQRRRSEHRRRGAGLYPIHATLTNISDGNLYVQITKTNADEFSEGLLVFDYFPYLVA